MFHDRITSRFTGWIGPSAILFAALVAGGCDPLNPLEDVLVLHETGRFVESLEPLRDLVEERPNDAEVLYLYGFALRRAGLPNQALWSLRKASDHPEWEMRAGLEFAKAGLEARNWTAAIDAAGRLLEANPDSVDALVVRGEARLEQKSDREAALADFDRALELEPENFAVRLSRVAALLALVRVEEAKQSLDALEGFAQGTRISESELAALCIARATFAKEDGDLHGAEDRYTDCLERFPTQGIVLAGAMSFFDEHQRSERATAILRAAILRNPQAVAYRNALAVRLRAAGATAEAEQILRAGIELENDALAAYAWSALAEHYSALEDYAAAAVALGRALELEGDAAPQRVLAYADLLAMAGHNEQALEVAERLDLQLYRDIVHARVLLNEHKPRQALERLEAVFRLWPDNAAARYYAARAAEQIGDFDRAIEEYRQSIRAGAKFSDAGLRLARLHEAEGAHEYALFAARQHVESHPGDEEATLLGVRLAQQNAKIPIGDFLAPLRRPALWARAVPIRAAAAAKRGGSEAAVALVRTDPRLELTNPRDVPALRALVIHLMNAGDPDEALAAVEASLAAHPDAAVFHAVRGLVLERRGASSQAVLAAYQRAVELDPEHAAALSALARLSAKHGDREAALALYDRATAADPRDLGPPRAAAELLAQVGKSQEAEQRLEDHLREHAHDSKAAMQLARLQRVRGAESDGILALARRAMRFGGGIEARKLVAQIHRERGEAELAANVLAEADP